MCGQRSDAVREAWTTLGAARPARQWRPWLASWRHFPKPDVCQSSAVCTVVGPEIRSREERSRHRHHRAVSCFGQAGVLGGAVAVRGHAGAGRPEPCTAIAGGHHSDASRVDYCVWDEEDGGSRFCVRRLSLGRQAWRPSRQSVPSRR